jgi:hypothetical protein
MSLCCRVWTQKCGKIRINNRGNPTRFLLGAIDSKDRFCLRKKNSRTEKYSSAKKQYSDKAVNPIEIYFYYERSYQSGIDQSSHQRLSERSAKKHYSDVVR